MLIERKHASQSSDAHRRRWFANDELDLILWLDERGDALGFQLCYDKLTGEKALTWHNDEGYTHLGVDDGEGRPGAYKSSPTLCKELPMDADRVSRIFRRNAKNLGIELQQFVLQHIDVADTALHMARLNQNTA